MWFNRAFPWMTLDSKSTKKLTRFENDLEFQNVFFNLLNIALYSFSIQGLPSTCNERYFKLQLIFKGYAALIKDDELGFLTLGVSPIADPDNNNSIGLNIYGEFNKVYAYGWNGFNKEYSCYMYGTDNTDVEAVICRDNDMMYPLLNVIFMYSKRLCDTMRTLDVTSKKLKNPYFITCDESQKSSVKKIIDDIDFNTDSIIVNKATMPDMFNILQTGVNPQAVSVLWQHYGNLQSEIRTLLGINSAANTDKKERLIVDEANANDILTDINVDIHKYSYDTFCKTVKEIWGLDIKFVSNINKIEAEQEDDKTLNNKEDTNEE